MARFWKRSGDESIERLLRANRGVPRDEFTSSILHRITETTFRPNHARSPRRIGLALILTVVALALASVLGGVGAASAGMGGIFHVATKAVTPSHHTTNTSSPRSTDSSENTGDENDGDHHQYQVGVCHWANHKYVLIFVSPQGAANHLKNHAHDKLPVNGTC